MQPRYLSYNIGIVLLPLPLLCLVRTTHALFMRNACSQSILCTLFACARRTPQLVDLLHSFTRMTRPLGGSPAPTTLLSQPTDQDKAAPTPALQHPTNCTGQLVLILRGVLQKRVPQCQAAEVSALLQFCCLLLLAAGLLSVSHTQCQRIAPSHMALCSMQWGSR